MESSEPIVKHFLSELGKISPLNTLAIQLPCEVTRPHLYLRPLVTLSTSTFRQRISMSSQLGRGVGRGPASFSRK